MQHVTRGCAAVIGGDGVRPLRKGTCFREQGRTAAVPVENVEEGGYGSGVEEDHPVLGDRAVCVDRHLHAARALQHVPCRHSSVIGSDGVGPLTERF